MVLFCQLKTICSYENQVVVNFYNSNGLNEEKELKSRSCMSYKFKHGSLIFLIVLNNN